ncbi:tRNA (adenosine(37)-N6)-threonylcarbamoyltransferase complex dimerization subunit type 1 TsaB [Gymnodinialimonas sp. 2305UL16-5]|uniref:tRNA (adenosine(37)-N6)-threonylcarbamoyltransferase complex dimerization subunit type 1 TsaB n=1 Tax=Gymnodinialimonas mytili TaxID=3126503 RepID=UPI003097C66A
MILAFDTSGPWVVTALLDGGNLLAERRLDMPKGQGQHLMSLIEDTLGHANTTLQDLAAIGVGTGPGNFTGIRIAVAAARGLALALDIPAIGVTGFDALYHGRSDDALVAIPGPRNSFYAQAFGTCRSAPQLVGSDAALPPLDAARNPALIASPGAALPERSWHPLTARIDGPPLAPSIARVAAQRLSQPQPRPAPLYVQPPDAAPVAQVKPILP